ncbi:hypothetical protein [Bifidobacterium sp. SO1]|uniref:hypothetical protein n=1 Tax=Bifidobacterium sp. SO1 TaxID=2809029 RepID=UPI001BDCA3A1|nr:hypothetical protein [Bifidobacterium sp. SO1]MBT1162119.1 hypothetical protein [Bifidobacterium sp. SO1]
MTTMIDYSVDERLEHDLLARFPYDETPANIPESYRPTVGDRGVIEYRNGISYDFELVRCHYNGLPMIEPVKASRRGDCDWLIGHMFNGDLISLLDMSLSDIRFRLTDPAGDISMPSIAVAPVMPDDLTRMFLNRFEYADGGRMRIGDRGRFHVENGDGSDGGWFPMRVSREPATGIPALLVDYRSPDDYRFRRHRAEFRSLFAGAWFSKFLREDE